VAHTLGREPQKVSNRYPNLATDTDGVVMTVVAITGVGGFIGAAAARRYLAAGATVRGLELPDVAVPEGVEIIRGSLTDASALQAAVQGADIVLHTAAIVAESGNWKDFHRINADGPVLVADAARAAGVRSFVHLSSVMVHGFDYADGINEDGALDPANNPYCWSKINAEFALADRSVPGEFAIHIIRPGDVYGPGSVPWVLRPVQHMRERTFLYVDPKRALINHVYIDNLLEAIDVVVSGKDATAGQPFIITDGQRTLARDFFGWFAEYIGSTRHPSLPGWLAEPLVGTVARVLPESMRRRLDLDRQSIRYLRRRGTFDTSRIRALGWTPRIDLAEGRALTAQWLTELGYTGPTR
jgi:nucleoside-diphosphate-sugar epimerase